MKLLKIDNTKYLSIENIESIDIVDRSHQCEMRFQLKSRPVQATKVFETRQKAEEFIEQIFSVVTGVIPFFEEEPVVAIEEPIEKPIEKPKGKK